VRGHSYEVISFGGVLDCREYAAILRSLSAHPSAPIKKYLDIDVSIGLNRSVAGQPRRAKAPASPVIDRRIICLTAASSAIASTRSGDLARIHLPKCRHQHHETEKMTIFAANL
jgi:hypothetical protein